MINIQYLIFPNIFETPKGFNSSSSSNSSSKSDSNKS